MTRRKITLTTTLVEAQHKHIAHCHYFRQYDPETAGKHTHPTPGTPEVDSYRIPAEGAPPREVEVTLHNVDLTDFLDAHMVVDELDHRDLLNAMDAGDVADWLRGEGYQVEEDE